MKKSRCFIAIREQQLLVRHGQMWSMFSQSVLIEQGIDSQETFFVGDYKQHACHVVELDADYEGYEWVPLRSQFTELSAQEYLLISRAAQLATWKNQHRFCGQCGRPTQAHAKEFALHCVPCELFFYPRISPCIMCLVVDGDYCLLAQHQRHKGGFYSTLAGFVEAGESLEQTLRREVMEEVGLTVSDLQYFSSQSWPFPQQLMIGYFANYASGEIDIEDEEIADAKWFHYSDLPLVSPRESLAGEMIHAFVYERERIARDGQ